MGVSNPFKTKKHNIQDRQAIGELRNQREYRIHATGFFAAIHLCRLEGIPDNKGVIAQLSKESGIKPPPEFDER